MSSKVLVYGWYNKGNLGDDLFRDAFQQLFPTFSFTFTDKITLSQVEGADAIFLGGGSFLGESLKIADKKTIEAVKKNKVFYIGVGAETAIHESHKEIMAVAQLVAIRTTVNLDKVKEINSNCIVIPDLVQLLSVTNTLPKIDKSVLVLPNISVVPKWNDPHWKHVSWDYFKTEFSQLLDQLYEDGYKINFLPMCVNDELNDCWAAVEIINRMRHRNCKYLLKRHTTLDSAAKLISQYQAVITQRFHGAILAELAGTPSLTIHHHDKLKNVTGPTLPYYGISKSRLIEELNNTLQTKVDQVLPIDRNIFDRLAQTVIGLMT